MILNWRLTFQPKNLSLCAEGVALFDRHPSHFSTVTYTPVARLDDRARGVGESVLGFGSGRFTGRLGVPVLGVLPDGELGLMRVRLGRSIFLGPGSDDLARLFQGRDS